MSVGAKKNYDGFWHRAIRPAEKINDGWNTRNKRTIVHYYLNEKTLCGISIEQNKGIGKPKLLTVFDPTLHYCKRCLLTLNTYDNLENKLSFPKPTPQYSFSTEKIKIE